MLQPVNGRYGTLDVAGELELEEVVGAAGMLYLVPSDDLLLPETDVPAVELDAMLGKRVAPDFFHGLDPAGGTHGVALAPFHVQGEPGAAHRADQGVVAGTSGFVRVVANRCVFLFAEAGIDCRVPVGNGVFRQCLVDDLLSNSQPVASLLCAQCRAETPEGVLTAKAATKHSKDFGNRLVILRTAGVGEALASRNTVQGKGLEDVDDRSGVRAGAWQRVVSGQILKHSCSRQKMIPRNKPPVGGKFCVTTAEMEFPARRTKLKFQRGLTQRVNAISVFFALQTPAVYRVLPLLAIPYCGF